MMRAVGSIVDLASPNSLRMRLLYQFDPDGDVRDCKPRAKSGDAKTVTFLPLSWGAVAHHQERCAFM